MMKQPALKEDDQLLFLSSLPKEGGVDRETLNRLLFGVKDWNRLLQKAFTHRLPLRLYSFLKRHNAPLVLAPQDWKKIEQTSRLAQFHVIAHEAELETLLPRFHQAGIDVLLLKGAALLQTVYREKPIRFFSDVDLMVHRETLEASQAILQDLGYQKDSHSHFPSEWHRRELEPHLCHNAFAWTQSERKINVDLHTEAFDDQNPFSLPRDWLWEEAEQIPVAEAVAFLPHPNRLFLHLLLHLAKHIGMRQNFLGWFSDLDECLQYFQGEIDGDFCWQAIQSSTRANKILEILAFIHLHFSSDLPQKFQRIIEERRIEPLALESIFTPGSQLDLSTFNEAAWLDRRELFFTYWNKVSGLRKKMWFLVRWVFPSREYLQTKYPFQTFPGKLAAYLRHFWMVFLKGMSLGIYFVLKKRYTPQVETYGAANAAENIPAGQKSNGKETG